MWGIFRRLFADARPIDWLLLIVDFLVLVAILWFELPEWWHKHKGKKMVSELAPLLEKGKELKTSVPYLPNPQWEVTSKWFEDVRAWDSDTQSLLAKHSSQALSAFTHIAHVRETDRAIVTPHGDMYPVVGHCGDVFQVLQAKLDNLQRIVEKADIYF